MEIGKLKQLTFLAAAALACGLAIAQDENGSACPSEGAFSSHFSAEGNSVNTFRCASGKWMPFKLGGKTRVTISYEISDGAKQLESGSFLTIDGQPSTSRNISETTYVSSAGKDANGRIVVTNSSLRTGREMLFAPRLSGKGHLSKHVEFSETRLNSMDTANVGHLQIHTPDVSKAELSNDFRMLLGKEMVIPLEGKTANETRQYLLKIKVNLS